MGEAAAEGVMHRRIEFHAATRPHAAAAAAAAGVAGGFGVERLNPDADKRVVVAAAARGEGQGKRLEKGEASRSGFDRELSAARIYLRRIGAGLHNLGNTCYLNSVLQCLTYTEPFVAYLQSGKHKSSCRTAGFCALCALQNHVRCALQSTGKILTPMQFVKNLRCISRSFRNSRQEDAHELMVNLLESMHKCCLPSGVPSESPSAYEKSRVHRIFGGRLRSQVRCTRCSHCSNKFDPFLDLSLEIANAATLVKALQNFTEEELLDGGEEQYNCQRCRQKVVAKKRFTIDKAPDVLTIHLKRFSPFNPHQKIDKKVNFQPTLNLKPFVSNSEGMDFRYSLYGVLVHAGWNTQSGHYYCFVRTSSGVWHNLDDNQVHQVHEADVLRQKAYMLFYVRDKVRSSVMHKGNGAANLSEKKLISEKITGVNGTIRNGLVETALNVSSFINGDVKLQKQASDNGQTSTISNTSQDQCSKNQSNTKVIEGAASQNNGTGSVQKVPYIHLDTAATLPTKTNETTSDSQKEITSPAQPDVIALHDQKAYEKPLQEQKLEPDGAFTDSGKDTPAAFATCNGADGLLGANGQASEPRTDPFCKPTLDISNTAAIVQTIPTKDTAVINATISSRENLTSSNEAKESAEPVKQHDEIVAVKELSAKDTDNIAYTEEQTSVLNNTLDVGQATVKELSVKDTDHIANAEDQASVQNIALGVGQVNSEKRICSEDSAQVVCSEDSAQVICSEDFAQVLDKDPRHSKMDFKSKKRVKYPVVNLFLGPKLLLLAALKLRKKIKHKRNKRRSTFSMDIESIANDQQTSTSETVRTKDISCKSHKRKCSRASASSDNGDQMFNKEQHLAGDSTSAADLPMGKKGKDPTLACELPSSCTSSVANQTDSRNCAHANERASWHFNILTRGLREITVPRWDDIDMPNTQATEFQYPRTNSIGYVLDEWDEDSGRRRKVRKAKEDSSGPNPFQETAEIRSRQRKRLKADQARSGNQPLRI